MSSSSTSSSLASSTGSPIESPSNKLGADSNSRAPSANENKRLNETNLTPTIAVAGSNSDENVRVKEECVDSQSSGPSSDTYDSSVWAQIFDENGVEMLEECDEGDEPMDGTTTSTNHQPHVATGSAWTPHTDQDIGQHKDTHALAYNDHSTENSGDNSSRTTLRGSSFGPHFPHAVLHEPTSSAAMMDSWQQQYTDHEMTSSMMDSANMIGTSMHVTGNHMGPMSSLHQYLLPGMDGRQQHADMFGASMTGMMWPNDHRSTTQDSLHPSHILTMERQMDGTPFPLSKPILRDDGVLLVGTELPSESSARPMPGNRIFVTNYKTFHPSQPPPFLQTQAEVCDLQWITPSAAIAAIGHDIHVLHVGNTKGDRRCRLLDALDRVHSDTIREIAVKHPNKMNSLSSSPISTLIASGGYDETIVVTDLRHATSGGDGRNVTTSMVTKFDGCDVVSSLRWIPNELSQLSWTTDGGDFQVADLRVRTAQLQVPLYSVSPLPQAGGLFCHEYLTNHKVALGFGTGQIVFVDIRMPRNTSCYGTLPTRMEAIGEIRTTGNGLFGFFGANGFSTAHIDASMNGFDNWTLSMTSPRTYPAATQKTSGAFSVESGNILAVSDNCGVLSIYNSNVPISVRPLHMMRGIV